MSQVRQFKLPDVGEGLTEADIVKWHIQPGDQVKVNQIIVEIETAKAVVELPCPYAGTVAELLVDEGATVDVGTPIISVTTGTAAAVPASSAPPAAAQNSRAETGTAAPASAVGLPGAADDRQASMSADLVPPVPAEPEAAEPAAAPAGAAAGGQERQANLVGYGVKVSAKTRRPRKSGATPGPARSATAQPAAPAEPAAAEPVAAPAAAQHAVLAKPPVRKLARDLGVDLVSVTGTGPNGSITRDDVHAATHEAAPQEAAPQEAAPEPAVTRPAVSEVPREERIPIRGVRKHTAAAMTRSAFTAPHVSMFLEIDITPTMEATERLKSMPDFASARVSPLLLAARALLTAVARHPMINSTWDEDTQEIVVRHYVNLGIAVATERGLIVPNVKDAQALSLPGLAAALTGLAQTGRAGKSSPADLAGGTISITNVGVFGIDTGTPILPPGEAAILAFGQVKDAPWVHEGELAVRKVCTLGMSFDHRIVDGDLGAAVLRDVGAMLADPLRMLAWS
jgi:pyruvate dehydrogenase E2 component (dihydrolipoamide acetyltransferase)